MGISSMSNGFCCPITEVLNTLSAKWTVEIMRELTIEPTRTRRFLARIPGLTMKCLRQRLIQLEEHGYVKRQEFDEKPRRVEYSISDRGRKLVELYSIIKQYANEMRPHVCVCPMELHEGNDFHCPARKELNKRHAGYVAVTDTQAKNA